MNDDPWGDDTFNEEDIEETFLKASQFEVSHHQLDVGNKPIVSDEEKKEIEDVFEGYNLIDDMFEKIDVEANFSSSQAIPGTQPRQRMQKDNAKSNINNIVSRNLGNNSPKSKNIRKNPVIESSSKMNKSLMPPPQLHFPSSSNFTLQNKTPPYSSVPSVTKQPFKSSYSNGERNQTRAAAELDENLRLRLQNTEKSLSDLRKDIMIKQGEVSCLRSDLQKKSLALDSEKIAKVTIIENHKKEIQTRVIEATHEEKLKTNALQKKLERLQADIAFKNREISELTQKCKHLEEENEKTEADGELEVLETGGPSHNSPAKLLNTVPPTPNSAKKGFPSNRFDFSNKEPENRTPRKGRAVKLTADSHQTSTISPGYRGNSVSGPNLFSCLQRNPNFSAIVENVPIRNSLYNQANTLLSESRNLAFVQLFSEDLKSVSNIAEIIDQPDGLFRCDAKLFNGKLENNLQLPKFQFKTSKRPIVINNGVIEDDLIASKLRRDGLMYNNNNKLDIRVSDAKWKLTRVNKITPKRPDFNESLGESSSDEEMDADIQREFTVEEEVRWKKRKHRKTKYSSYRINKRNSLDSNNFKSAIIVPQEWINLIATLCSEGIPISCSSSSKTGTDVKAPSDGTRISSEYKGVCNHAANQLYNSVLNVLAAQAAYLEKDRRAEESQCEGLELQETAVVLLEQLLPLKIRSNHSPMKVLTHLLYPRNRNTPMASRNSVVILQCLTASLHHPDSDMATAVTVVKRLSDVCSHLSTVEQVTALIQGLTAMLRHCSLAEALCSLSEDCLVWKVCICFLAMTLEPYTVNPRLTSYYKRLLHSRANNNKAFTSLEKNLLRQMSRSNRLREAHLIRDCTHECSGAFSALIYEVLRSSPQWFMSDCDCATVLLMSLIVLLHAEARQLITATLLDSEMSSCPTIDPSLLSPPPDTHPLVVTGGRWSLVWQSFRLLKLFMTKHVRSSESLNNLPHYVLFCKELSSFLPLYPELSDTETDKMLSRLLLRC